jgi:hypothetical protein
MEFRLVYEGALKAKATPKHKHGIREALHPQLKELWQHPSLFGPVVPAHRRCNLRAAAAKANEVRRERYGPTLSKPRRIWNGAIRLDDA